jgi:GNAT superfamily N-acetyltransferase
MSGGIEIERLRAGRPELALVAAWRHAAFFAETLKMRDDCLRELEALVARDGLERGWLARLDGAPAGTALLIATEIDARHRVTPWLAGLYVTPEARLCGVGARLVETVEAAARGLGFERLYLYSHDAEGFYAARGWTTLERLDEGAEEPFVLMARDLG